MTLEHEFYGPNFGYILELYERYQADPNEVDEATRQLFETWQPTGEAAPLSATHDLSALTGAVNLAQAIRSYGYLSAHLNPLEEEPTLANNSLVTLEFHHLKEDDLRNLPAEIVNLPGEQTSGNAWQAIQTLRKIYCGQIGYDYGHIRIPKERDWLYQAAETGRFRPPQLNFNEKKLLEQLT